MSQELLSKTEWTCKMKKVKQEIINETFMKIESEASKTYVKRN